jgi:hypothetical protein
MTKKTTVLKNKVNRGEKVTKGQGWKLVAPGRIRAFRGNLLEVVYVGRTRLGIFRVS